MVMDGNTLIQGVAEPEAAKRIFEAGSHHYACITPLNIQYGIVFPLFTPLAGVAGGNCDSTLHIIPDRCFPPP